MEYSGSVHHTVQTFASDDGYPIYADLRFPDTGTKLPIIIICHSFMAFKEWGFFPYLGEKLASAGFATLIFNFSFNGVAGSGNRITDFDKFERNTFTRELNDCDAVIRAIQRGLISGDTIDPDRIIFLGHSRGAGISVVAASRNPAVKALISLSPIGTFERWTEHQKRRWREEGSLPLSKDTSASPLRLGIALLEDIETNGAAISIAAAASELSIPWLIVHGTMDVTVPVREAEHLYEVADKTKTELVLLDKIGHLYHAASREEDSYVTLNQILDIVISWLQKHI